MKFKTGKNNISYLGSDFQEWFGDMDFEKVEANLKSKKLPRYMTVKEILEELKPDTLTLDEIYAHLKIADKNDWMIFYCKDKYGVLRTVHARWHGDGWRVDASSVLISYGWDGGYLVFFRNSVPSETLADTFKCPHCKHELRIEIV